MVLSAGIAQEEHEHGIVGTPTRQELARPVDSTAAMAAAVAPTVRSVVQHSFNFYCKRGKLLRVL